VADESEEDKEALVRSDYAKNIIVRAITSCWDSMTKDDAHNLIRDLICTTTYWILVLYHDHGINTYLFLTEDDAWKRALEFAVEWQNDIGENYEEELETFKDLVTASKTKEAVELYFQCMSNESFIIEPISLEQSAALKFEVGNNGKKGL
jgi:hypothetical protein